MATQADAERLRRAQAGIRALVIRDLETFFRALPLGSPERARDAMLEYVPLLVQQYGESAAAMAADWYDAARADARVPGKYRAEMVDSPYADVTEQATRRAAGGLFTDAPEAALVAVSAFVPKYILAAARATIARSTDRDPRASGWKRVTRTGSCRFCRMLAGRGAVYKEATVHFASHGDCNCAAVPSWDQNAPEVDVSLYKASQRTSTMTPAQRESHNALIQRAIDQYA